MEDGKSLVDLKAPYKLYLINPYKTRGRPQGFFVVVVVLVNSELTTKSEILTIAVRE